MPEYVVEDLNDTLVDIAHDLVCADRHLKTLADCKLFALQVK